MAKTRTFIGVGLSAPVGREIAAAVDRLRSAAPGVRWVAEANLHCTLRFVGDLGDQQLVDVCTAVQAATRSFEPFSVEVGGAGAFPNIANARTLWIGVASGSASGNASGSASGSDALLALQADIDEAVTALGHRGEKRRYVPHVTIGRINRGADGASSTLAEELARLESFVAGTTPVTEVTIFASELERDGPVYHVLARCPLGG
ncbi:MAG: RNA 2',3'-cyclic phosphodiesterase [Planctomycetota bacterium]